MRRPPDYSRRHALWVTIVVLGFITPAPSWPAVSWQVHHGLGGVHRDGGLVPIHVRLENEGGADLTVRLEGTWDGAGFRAQRTVDLAAQTVKEVNLYLGPMGYGSELGVVMRDLEEATLEEIVMTSVRVRPQTKIVAALGPHPLALGSVGGEQGSVKVVHLDPSRLPTSAEGLRSLDLVVWQDPQPGALAADQVAALNQWVSSGGHLVLVAREVGANARFLLPLTEVEAVELVTVRELPSLAAAAQEELGSFAEPLAVVRLAERTGPEIAHVWMEEPWGAIAAEEPRGLGWVTVLGFDVTDSRLARWPGLPKLWSQLLERRVRSYDSDEELETGPSSWVWMTPLNLRATAASLLNDDRGEAPPLAWLGLFLILYLAAIGPIDYVILRRFGRLTWTWVTYPSAVLVFALGAYAIAATSRSSEAKLRYILHRDVPSGSSAQIEELHVSMLVGRAGIYRLAPRAPGAIPLPPPEARPAYIGLVSSRPLGDSMVCEQGRSAVAARVPRWGFLSATFLHHSPAGGARVEGQVEAVAWNQIRGTLLPRLGLDLEDAWLVAVVEGQLVGFRIGPLVDGQITLIESRDGQALVAPDPYAGPNLQPELAQFATALMAQTGRRLLREQDEALVDDPAVQRRASSLRQDSHPHHDWSALLATGNPVLVGWARDGQGRFHIEGVDVEAEGIVVVRAPVLAVRDQTPDGGVEKPGPRSVEP